MRCNTYQEQTQPCISLRQNAWLWQSYLMLTDPQWQLVSHGHVGTESGHVSDDRNPSRLDDSSVLPHARVLEEVTIRTLLQNGVRHWISYGGAHVVDELGPLIRVSRHGHHHCVHHHVPGYLRYDQPQHASTSKRELDLIMKTERTTSATLSRSPNKHAIFPFTYPMIRLSIVLHHEQTESISRLTESGMPVVPLVQVSSPRSFDPTRKWVSVDACDDRRAQDYQRQISS